MTDDLAAWLDLCSQGTLYEHLAQLLGTDRKTAKDGMIQCIFKKPCPMQKMDEYVKLVEQFPTIAAYLVSRKKSVHQRVAHDCQRMESGILIKRVVPRLKNVDMVTCHDEFIVLENETERATKAISGEFKKAGVTLKLKITKL